MKLNYDENDNRVILDGNGTMILSKNQYGLQVENFGNEDNPKLTIQHTHTNTEHGGKLRQLLAATEWIYGLNYNIQRRTKKIANITTATIGVTSLVSLYILNKRSIKRRISK